MTYLICLLRLATCTNESIRRRRKKETHTQMYEEDLANAINSKITIEPD